MSVVVRSPSVPPLCSCSSLALLACAALAGACGGEAPSALDVLRSPIVGGQKSTSAFVPAAGALVINVPGYYQSFCSGTLIGPKTVLTAAHCLHSSAVPPGTPIGFFIGASLYAPGASSVLVPAASSHLHPSYDNSQPPPQLSDYYDIAVMRLSQAAPSSVTPVKMIRPEEVDALVTGRQVTIIGYGQTNPQIQSSGVKYQGVTSIAQLGSSELWIYSPTGRPQKCHGDSGGPTLVDLDPGPGEEWRVVGVASRAGEGCTSGSVETRVDSHLSFVHSVANDIPCDSGLSEPCTPPPPPKQLGEACDDAAECADELCLPLPESSICTRYCDPQHDDCPGEYSCAAASGGKGVCVVVKLKYGAPCAGHDECESGICASQGERSFCSKNCTDDAECGEGMACVDAGGPLVCAAEEEGGCHVGASGGGTPARGLALAALLALLLARRRRR